MLEFGEVRTAELMRRHGVEGDRLIGDAFRCDRTRAELLAERGWEPDGLPPYVVNRALISSVPAPAAPPGYSLRSATGVEEAPALAALHGAAFPGAGWTPDEYRKVMESPGYDPVRELVAVAPDGGLAAFAVTWHDHLNRTGLLEAVGTHPDHRGRGVGRAVVRFAAHRLAAAGMDYAIVANEGSNAASAALYRSAGFEPWHLVDGYEKSIG